MNSRKLRRALVEMARANELRSQAIADMRRAIKQSDASSLRLITELQRIIKKVK